MAVGTAHRGYSSKNHSQHSTRGPIYLYVCIYILSLSHFFHLSPYVLYIYPLLCSPSHGVYPPWILVDSIYPTSFYFSPPLYFIFLSFFNLCSSYIYMLPHLDDLTATIIVVNLVHNSIYDCNSDMCGYKCE